MFLNTGGGATAEICKLLRKDKPVVYFIAICSRYHMWKCDLRSMWNPLRTKIYQFLKSEKHTGSQAHKTLEHYKNYIVR